MSYYEDLEDWQEAIEADIRDYEQEIKDYVEVA